jgi:protein involved in polysaccharide export with SLBB domain
MARRVFSRFRFSIKNLLVLVLGIAIGFALNAWTLQMRLGRVRPVASTPGYIVQPDDELRISVSGKRPAGSPRISARYVVDPEGFVDITPYCRVEVAGMSIPDAQSAVEQALRTKIELPLAVIEVTAKNSRCYYVVVKTPGQMDSVTKSQLGGGKTVLDVIESSGLIAWPTTSQIWIERASANGVGAVTLLPITTGASTGPTAISDCKLMPGDRLTISNPPVPQ